MPQHQQLGTAFTGQPGHLLRKQRTVGLTDNGKGGSQHFAGVAYGDAGADFSQIDRHNDHETIGPFVYIHYAFCDLQQWKMQLL
jgi:hypothetical protein